jgi:hypothetical protein
MVALAEELRPLLIGRRTPDRLRPGTEYEVSELVVWGGMIMMRGKRVRDGKTGVRVYPIGAIRRELLEP